MFTWLSKYFFGLHMNQNVFLSLSSMTVLRPDLLPHRCLSLVDLLWVPLPFLRLSGKCSLLSCYSQSASSGSAVCSVISRALPPSTKLAQVHRTEGGVHPKQHFHCFFLFFFSSLKIITTKKMKRRARNLNLRTEKSNNKAWNSRTLSAAFIGVWCKDHSCYSLTQTWFK